MTPGQCKHDQDLARAMRVMAQRIEPRSRKISDTLKLAADRIEALVAGIQVGPPPALDQHGNIIQPASAPDQTAIEA